MVKPGLPRLAPAFATNAIALLMGKPLRELP